MTTKMICFFAALFVGGVCTSSALAQCTDHHLTLSTLNGKYNFGGRGDRFEASGTLDERLVETGFIVFDGNGRVTHATVFENLNGSGQTLTETGTYSLNNDCSFAVSLMGSEARNFNVEVSSLDSATHISQESDATDVGLGPGEGAANGMVWKLIRGKDPINGCRESDLAGLYGGELAGINSSSQKVFGVERIALDKNGNISGSGFITINGSLVSVPFGGNIVLNSDCTFSGTLSFGTTTKPVEGIAGFRPPPVRDDFLEESISRPKIALIQLIDIGPDAGLLSMHSIKN